MCNNLRSQKNANAYRKVSDQINKEVRENINNQKNEIEEAIRFLNTSPDASSAFSLPVKPPNLREYNFSYAEEGKVIGILNNIKTFLP